MLLSMFKKVVYLLQAYSEQKVSDLRAMFTVEKGVDAAMFFHYNSVLFFTTKRGPIW